METAQNFSLKEYNTFGVECIADTFILVETESELHQVLKERNPREKLLTLGGGSNILLKNKFEGEVIKLSFKDITVVEESDTAVIIDAGAGVVWDDLVKFAVDHNYSGIENLSAIPGSTGAAPIQNIGAYGQELSNILYKVNGFYIKTKTKEAFSNSDCKLGYRESVFKKELKNEFIITSVELKLGKSFVPEISYGPVREELIKAGIKKPELQDMRNAIIKIRSSKLPDPKLLGNAGSFFKNPVIDKNSFDKLQQSFPEIKGYPAREQYKVYAGWLIEKCGWKGIRKGNVGTYPLQALVIVNYGGATAMEILNFKNEIISSVQETFGITLEEEVNII